MFVFYISDDVVTTPYITTDSTEFHLLLLLLHFLASSFLDGSRSQAAGFFPPLPRSSLQFLTREVGAEMMKLAGGSLCWSRMQFCRVLHIHTLNDPRINFTTRQEFNSLPPKGYEDGWPVSLPGAVVWMLEEQSPQRLLNWANQTVIYCTPGVQIRCCRPLQWLWNHL